MTEEIGGMVNDNKSWICLCLNRVKRPVWSPRSTTIVIYKREVKSKLINQKSVTSGPNKFAFQTLADSQLVLMIDQLQDQNNLLLITSKDSPLANLNATGFRKFPGGQAVPEI